MEPSSTHDPVRRILTAAGVGTAAAVVSLAAAVPALAIGTTGQDSHSGTSQSQPAGDPDDAGSSSAQQSSGQDADANGDAHSAAAGSNGAGSSGSTGNGTPASGSPTGGANADGHNPPGNNGTVFIHDVAGDHTPHNVPHVGCTFYVDFFGFDKGQTVTMTFTGQAPTGKGTDLPFSPSTVDVGGDNAGGAGNDWDAEVPVTLDTSVLGAAATQGYHVMLTVSTGQPTQANSGQVKHKVFWIAPCTQTTPQGGSQQNGGSEQNGGPVQNGGTTLTQTAPTTAPTTSAMGGSTSGAQVLGLTLHRSAPQHAATKASTHVLGLAVHRAPSSARASTLPFTGAEVGGLLAAAAAALGGGAALMLAGRRRRRTCG